ncbi:MAG: immunoglobulin domain-containing protein, partial [Verrucomicrobiota bacterium]
MKRLKDWMLAMWALLPLCGLGQQWVSSRESTTALRTVVAGDFGFLAGGGPSAEPLIRSPDGVQWTKVPLGTTRTIQSITAGVGPGNQPYFVAVDHAGGILRSASPSGPWGQVAQTRSGLSRVASLGSLVVACGADGLLVESLDGGTTWKEVVSPVPGKSWRFLVADEGAHPENVLWAQFLVVAEDGSAGCRDSTGRWVSLASLGSIVPITGVEWFGDYFWVFSGQSPVGWSGRFIAENMPIGLWTAHVLPSFQSTARYRAVAALGDQAYAFGDSGLFRYGPLAGFPGLENILLLGESVGNFTGSDSGRWGVAAVTDAGYVFRLGTNSPPKPEITVTIRPTRTRLSEGEVLFLDLDIVASSKVARSVQWRINGQPVAGNDPRVPGASTWYLKLSVTVADSGVYQAEVEFTDGTRVNTGAGVDIRVGPRPPLEWSSVSVPGGFSNALTGLAVTEDRWLMGGGFGLVVRTNGSSWSRAAGIDQPVYWLEKVNGTCFALGVSLIARSEDGLVWKSGVGVGGQPFGGDFYGLLPWSGGYLAFGATLAGGGMAWTSIDGLTWAPDLRFAGGAPWYGGATDGRNLVLAGTRGSILRVLFDGSIQKSSIASGEDIFSLAFFGGRFLGVTSTGRIWTSTEGLTWTLQKDLSFDGFVFRKTGGLLFVLGSNGPGVFWSSDGVQWQQGGWIGSAPDPIFMDVLLVSGSYRLLGPEGIVGASQNLGDVEVPVLVPPNIRQPTAGSSIARIEIPALWSERVQLEWWLDGALIPGATGPVVEISTSGWLKEGQVWAVARWWNGSVPVGPFRIVPQRQDPLQVSLNTPGGRLPLGSDLRVNVRGLQGSGLVRIRVSIDANEDGQRQPDEPVVESFLVRDGGVPTLGGVRDGARPGDEDGLVNGG